jgi:hypothetical protein
MELKFNIFLLTFLALFLLGNHPEAKSSTLSDGHPSPLHKFENKLKNLMKLVSMRQKEMAEEGEEEAAVNIKEMDTRNNYMHWRHGR